MAHSSRVQSIMVGKAHQWELKASGHSASTVRKQRETDAGAQLPLLFPMQSGTSAHGMVTPTGKEGQLPQSK